MSYFCKMLDSCLKEERDKKEYEENKKENDKKEYENEERKKEKYDQTFINELELSYQIYGKRFTLDRKINYFLRIISNKPKLYSTNKKKYIFLFHYELKCYYHLYSMIYKEFDFIKNEFYFRQKYMYLKKRNNYVFKYIQYKYERFTIEEMLDVAELFDLKNKVIYLLEEVSQKLKNE